MECVEEGTRM